MMLLEANTAENPGMYMSYSLMPLISSYLTKEKYNTRAISLPISDNCFVCAQLIEKSMLTGSYLHKLKSLNCLPMQYIPKFLRQTSIERFYQNSRFVVDNSCKISIMIRMYKTFYYYRWKIVTMIVFKNN